jgi:hypothetical protein
MLFCLPTTLFVQSRRFWQRKKNVPAGMPFSPSGGGILGDAPIIKFRLSY